MYMPIGDPAVLHKLISEGNIEMDRLQQYDTKSIHDTAITCGIPISGKCKVCLRFVQFIIVSLHLLSMPPLYCPLIDRTFIGPNHKCIRE